jgi:hypothetical protein
MYQRRSFDGQRIIDDAEIAMRAQSLFNDIYQSFGGSTVAIVATAHRFELVPEGEWNPSTCATECAAWGIDVHYLRNASRQRNRERDQEYRATTARKRTA